MATRVAVILNVHAGSVQGRLLAEQVADVLAAAGCDPTVTTGDGPNLTRLAQQALHDSHTRIVASGGDGTVNAVASVLVGSDAALGVLPLGTLNHFAKDLQLPLDMAAAAQVIAAGHHVTVDVGEVNGRIFVNNSSIGIYPSLVTERERLRRLGQPKWIAFGVAFSRIWTRYRHLHTTIQTAGQPLVATTPFVFVGNNEYELEGLRMGGRRSLTQGQLHVCLAPHMTRGDLLRMVGSAMVNRLGAVEAFESFLAPECDIRGSGRSLLVSTDGEVTRMLSPLRYRIRPGALRVIVPAEREPGEPA